MMKYILNSMQRTSEIKLVEARSGVGNLKYCTDREESKCFLNYP